MKLRKRKDSASLSPCDLMRCRDYIRYARVEFLGCFFSSELFLFFSSFKILRNERQRNPLLM